jgi:hypothetical protein
VQNSDGEGVGGFVFIFIKSKDGLARNCLPGSGGSKRVEEMTMEITAV